MGVLARMDNSKHPYPILATLKTVGRNGKKQQNIWEEGQDFMFVQMHSCKATQ